jgi:hypothetical protein
MTVDVLRTLSTALVLMPRTEGEKSLPSGGWQHWVSRARSAGLLTVSEEYAYSSLPAQVFETAEQRVLRGNE